MVSALTNFATPCMVLLTRVKGFADVSAHNERYRASTTSLPYCTPALEEGMQDPQHVIIAEHRGVQLARPCSGLCLKRLHMKEEKVQMYDTDQVLVSIVTCLQGLLIAANKQW